MSEKKRQKKDGERKDKKNQAMRDAENDERQANSSQAASSDLADIEQGAGSTDNPRQGANSRS
jgi:hypothetical protein